MEFMHKMAAVTDGRTAVGKACIRMLAREGYNVLVFNHGVPLDEELAEEMKRSGVSYMASDAALGDSGSLEQAVREGVEALGPLHGVIYNYFTVIEGNISELTGQSFEQNYDKNIIPALTASQVFGKLMERGGQGKLVFIGSIHDEKPSGFAPLYSMTMGAVKNLSREAALSLGTKSISSVFVELGPLQEETYAPSSEYTTFYEGYRYKIPSGEAGKAEDVAELCSFLLSSRCRFVNGAEIRMDGGLTLHYVDEKANHRGLMRGKESV